MDLGAPTFYVGFAAIVNIVHMLKILATFYFLNERLSINGLHMGVLCGNGK